MTAFTPKFGVGASVLRLEDQAFITGRGRYTDDFSLPRMLHAVFVRSPVAHARIRNVDLSRAAAEELGFLKAGRTRVRLNVLQLGEEDSDRASADAVTSADARRTAAAGDR